MQTCSVAQPVGEPCFGDQPHGLLPHRCDTDQRTSHDAGAAPGCASGHPLGASPTSARSLLMLQSVPLPSSDFPVLEETHSSNIFHAERKTTHGSPQLPVTRRAHIGRYPSLCDRIPLHAPNSGNSVPTTFRPANAGTAHSLLSWVAPSKTVRERSGDTDTRSGSTGVSSTDTPGTPGRRLFGPLGANGKVALLQ